MKQYYKYNALNCHKSYHIIGMRYIIIYITKKIVIGVIIIHLTSVCVGVCIMSLPLPQSSPPPHPAGSPPLTPAGSARPVRVATPASGRPTPARPTSTRRAGTPRCRGNAPRSGRRRPRGRGCGAGGRTRGRQTTGRPRPPAGAGCRRNAWSWSPSSPANRSNNALIQQEAAGTCYHTRHKHTIYCIF